MRTPDSQATVDFLKQHLGHEMKYLAFAVAEFPQPDPNPHRVSLQDSALVRGRSVIDFFRKGSIEKCVRAQMFYLPGTAIPANDALAEEWFNFISGRISHIGRNRDATVDQWPGRAVDEEKGEDRLQRLAQLVIRLMRDRAELMVDDARDLLKLVAQRAEEYLDGPSEARFHAMDPANL